MGKVKHEICMMPKACSGCLLTNCSKLKPEQAIAFYLSKRLSGLQPKAQLNSHQLKASKRIYSTPVPIPIPIPIPTLGLSPSFVFESTLLSFTATLDCVKRPLMGKLG